MSADEFLERFGSTLTLDILNSYVLTVNCILAFILNIFAFIIFLTKEFKIELYFYLRVYTFNNIILSLVNSFNFVAYGYHLFDWSNSYWTQFYYSYISIPVLNTLYFFGSLLSIFILLNRIGVFNKPVRDKIEKKVVKICIASFIFSSALDSVLFFCTEPAVATTHTGPGQNTTVWYRYNLYKLVHMNKCLDNKIILI